MSKFQISLIIPSLNEEQHLPRLIENIRYQDLFSQVEIIVVDGNSDDKSYEIAMDQADIALSTCIRCRAHQMNLGAKMASTDLLYFVHADVLPPNGFVEIILENHKNGAKIGSFRQKFEGNHRLLKINAFFTRFDFTWCRGGDQTLFVDKILFEQLNGYDETFSIMEEYDFMNRARKIAPFTVLEQSTLVSARKYDNNSWLRVQLANRKAMRMFKKGTHPEIIEKMYKKSLHPH
ncbi:MAG: TIGR04283 family arsenosugar biosynthesis glycosyltransferase [Crocinitomicaceae bacterium]